MPRRVWKFSFCNRNFVLAISPVKDVDEVIITRPWRGAEWEHETRREETFSFFFILIYYFLKWMGGMAEGEEKKVKKKELWGPRASRLSDGRPSVMRGVDRLPPVRTMNSNEVTGFFIFSLYRVSPCPIPPAAASPWAYLPLCPVPFFFLLSFIEFFFYQCVLGEILRISFSLFPFPRWQLGKTR